MNRFVCNDFSTWPVKYSVENSAYKSKLSTCHQREVIPAVYIVAIAVVCANCANDLAFTKRI